ncbi:hypothetical protein H9661_00050 [Clostridium sp. Sa3CVN1]|uniref:Uncharacterized protein n=2 Tax=Clostridium cibarium TaxID=2762247 RepID=A0ABR8PNH3_9CLOT|nr:hypothetical protein [Clostridium cibarium]MBD7909732.1 hypothetical protein [Clostridium cibarium]
MLQNKKLRHFVRWYADGQDEADYERIRSYYNDFDMQKALDTYLERDDVKQAIQYVTKSQKDMNLIKIYNTMVKKALEGDTNSANWVVKFSESDFFIDRKSAIDDIISGLDMNE